MNRSPLHRTRNILAASLTALIVAACASQPKISSQTAPQADLARYHTYGFMEKLGTDTAGYTSITTQLMKDAVSRELAARGFAPGDNPDILVNFLAATKDKVEGRSDPRIGVTYGTGGWGHHGVGVGVGIGSSDIRSVREDTLTVDLVDREKNVLVWTGSAVFRPTQKEASNARKRVNDVVTRIFTRYPKAPSAPAK